MTTIHLIAAARPNFMKVAPLYHALESTDWAEPVLVHTGQHYDANMSDVFFRQLGLPQPDVSLGVGSGSHAAQTAQIMMRFEGQHTIFDIAEQVGLDYQTVRDYVEKFRARGFVTQEPIPSEGQTR